MRSDGRAATSSGGDRQQNVILYGGLFTAAVGAFCLSQVIGHRFGLASDIIGVAGDATCGWSWLLVRALFQARGEDRARWPLALVMGLVAIGGLLRLPFHDGDALARMTANLGGLISSALLLLAAIEPLKGLTRETPVGERRFRLIFASGYAGLLLIAVIWLDGAPAGGLAAEWRMAIKSGCAVFALVGMAAAIRYRASHPSSQSAPARRRDLSPELNGLADRVRSLMIEEAAYSRANFKVADLARSLGEPEYKVTQCVTGALGFRNFNQMTNHFRIEDAKQRLTDPANDHLPILTIAYDCGFGSIGPFNRAFKAAVGVPPQQFRRMR